MTEKEWLKCPDLDKMLGYIDGTPSGSRKSGGKASKRKMRLFAVACCRHVWDLITDKRHRNAVEASEAYADGLIRQKELVQKRMAAYRPGANYPHKAAEAVAQPKMAARYVAMLINETLAHPSWYLRPRNEIAYQSFVNWTFEPNLLREIMGNPFRPITVDPAWLTATVKQLAEGIYEERAFDRMPILGDALEEASCSNADILNHCRQPGEHCRGCWVVDLLLGKN